MIPWWGGLLLFGAGAFVGMLIFALVALDRDD